MAKQNVHARIIFCKSVITDSDKSGNVLLKKLSDYESHFFSKGKAKKFPIQKMQGNIYIYLKELFIDSNNNWCGFFARLDPDSPVALDVRNNTERTLPLVKTEDAEEYIQELSPFVYFPLTNHFCFVFNQKASSDTRYQTYFQNCLGKATELVRCVNNADADTVFSKDLREVMITVSNLPKEDGVFNQEAFDRMHDDKNENVDVIKLTMTAPPKGFLGTSAVNRAKKYYEAGNIMAIKSPDFIDAVKLLLPNQIKGTIKLQKFDGEIDYSSVHKEITDVYNKMKALIPD